VPQTGNIPPNPAGALHEAPAIDRLADAELPGELAGILDRYMADLQAGTAPDRRELLAAHPALAGQLEQCLAGIEFVHGTSGPAAAAPAALGEYRIIREIGRGGMGVVYEAEQTSLHRPVALKVLRFGVVADEEAMKRFRREAETVARLHHTNIVPIFAIGSENGVHYYAMQLIDGRSLAEVLAESQRSGTPPSADNVARWGLQAAEALGHAHERGVIHRDIKPSNLLLDREGQVWLTDFGLAKRADEATLTVHGTLMGTPRYMSPEQAAALQQPVDRRTDIYSLGASLFELATGRPVFESTAPHLVVAQILTEEPALPRQFRPELPRDLETIILKCLAKEPGQRYQTAHALANDLRAVLEGRPIAARRVRWTERAARYVRQRRKTFKGAGFAALGTLLLLTGAFLLWRYYSDWRLGRVVLKTGGPSLTAQLLLDSTDEPIGEPFSIGDHSALTLPAGDYRLRVCGSGLMGQTYRLAFNRGETMTHSVSLDDTSLLQDAGVLFSSIMGAPVGSQVKADFVQWNGAALIRFDARTGERIWYSEALGDAQRAAAAMSAALGGHQPPAKLVEPAPDLNGDGTGDLVWAMIGTSSLLAVSGRDGRSLWSYSPNPDGTRGLMPTVPPATRQAHAFGGVLGGPCAADVDGDGTADLIGAFLVTDFPAAIMGDAGKSPAGAPRTEMTLPGRRVVAAVSGRTGKELWHYVIDPKPTDLPEADLDRGITYVSQSKGALVAFVDDARWIGLDAATGRPKRPSFELGFKPVQAVQYADLDGDGAIELLALEAKGTFEPFTAPDLVAFSVGTGKRLWAARTMAYFKPQAGISAHVWPLITDFDGDGRAEIVVPHVDALPPRNGTLYGGLRVLDGPTGQPRWHKPLWPGMQFGPDTLAHLLAAPDLDADGTRDLIAVSRYSGRVRDKPDFTEREPTRAYVDAVSGKDGRTLWSWRSDALADYATLIWPAFWWGHGPDGWPLLVLPTGGGLRPGKLPVTRFGLPDPPAVHLLAAGSGREAHRIKGLAWPRSADLDGDGLADLWGSFEDKLRAFRGDGPEAWRALGGFQRAGDLDGDGTTDVVSDDLPAVRSVWPTKPESRTVLARSGRDGRLLWQSLLDPRAESLPWGKWASSYSFVSLPLPCDDLDGDGLPDVVVIGGPDGIGPRGQESVSFHLSAHSGSTGRWLWSAASPRPSLPAGTMLPAALSYIQSVAACPRDGRRLPELLVLYQIMVQQSAPPSGFDVYYRLARVSGRDGRLLWDIPLIKHSGGLSKLMRFAPEFADADGDGSPEIFLLLDGVSASAPSPLELCVLSLASGEKRWKCRLDPGLPTAPAFAVGDLDGDRRPEVVVREHPDETDHPDGLVTALEGQTGTRRWTWRSGTQFAATDNTSTFRLVDFDGNGRKEVCLSFALSQKRRRVEIIDARGRSRVGRDIESVNPPTLWNVDLDGDGREELLIKGGSRLRACRGDLSEQWSVPGKEPIREILPAASGRPATVVMSPSLGIDGATGKPVWSIGKARSILPSIDGKSPPCGLAGPDGTTACRVALPIAAAQPGEVARGAPAIPISARDDLRWKRALPWVWPVEPSANPLVQLAMGATLINVCLPLAILWLATRRRFWSVRLLLALPAVVALVIVGYSEVIGLLPNRPRPPEPILWSLLVDATIWSVSALPVVYYAAALGSAVVRHQWKRTRLLVAGAGLAAVVIAGVLLLFDHLTMPVIEHYDWSGWHQGIYLGIYGVGALALLSWFVRAAWRVLRSLRRRLPPQAA